MVTVSERPIPVVSSDGPMLGMLGQVGVLAGLASTVGLGAAGWLTGTVFGLLTWVILDQGLRRAGMWTLGPANQVTLARATLVGGVTALVADFVTGGVVPVAVLVVLASVALALDGVDGQVARRTGCTSPLGARFDMEVDAFLILVLSIFVAGSMGWWVLAIGAFRYAFVAAAWLLPWLTAPLPPKFSRKVVAAVQGVFLVVAGAGLLPGIANYAVVVLALGSLSWSFGRDVHWLARARHPRDLRRIAGLSGSTPRDRSQLTRLS